MNLHFTEIAKKLQISNSSVRNYMARPEFSHANLHRGIYYGVTNEDLIKLQEIYQKRGWRGRK